MSIPIFCPNCTASAYAPDEAAGRTVRCKKCGTRFLVPKQSSWRATEESLAECEVVPEPLPYRSPPPIPSLADDLDIGRDYDVQSDRPSTGRGRLIAGSILGIFIAIIGGSAVVGGIVYVINRLTKQAQSSNAGDKPAPPVKLTEQQKAAAADAIKALGKVEAATEVGVTYLRYMEVLGETKALVNEAERSLPRGKVLTALSEAMEAYQDAAKVWHHKIEYRNLGLKKEDGYGKLIDRYKLPLENKGEADPDWAIKMIWLHASLKLIEARTWAQ